MQRLIVFIVIFALFLVFIVLNLSEKSDVYLGFVDFKDAPVFLIVFFSFILGMVFSIPLSLGRKHKKINEKDSSGSGEQKKRRISFKTKKNTPGPGLSDRVQPASNVQSDLIKKENGQYGID